MKISLQVEAGEDERRLDGWAHDDYEQVVTIHGGTYGHTQSMSECG